MRWAPILATVISLFAPLSCASAQAQAFVVVVAVQSPIKSLSAASISQLFLGRIESLPGIGPVRPIELRFDANLRLEFHAAMTGMSEQRLRSHWAAMVFTGKAKPPCRFDSVAALRARLQEDLSAVTYLRREDLDATLRQVYP